MSALTVPGMMPDSIFRPGCASPLDDLVGGGEAPANQPEVGGFSRAEGEERAVRRQDRFLFEGRRRRVLGGRERAGRDREERGGGEQAEEARGHWLMPSG
jgi:hypothetical protein